MGRSVTVRSAWIGAMAIVLAAIIGGIIGFLKPYRENHSNTNREKTDELVMVLEHRASKILELMDKEKQKVLISFRIRIASFQYPDFDVKKFVEELEAMKTLFLELHKKHLDAIKAGNFILAHELLADIYDLLWKRDKFLVSKTNPSSFKTIIPMYMKDWSGKKVKSK